MQLTKAHTDSDSTVRATASRRFALAVYLIVFGAALLMGLPSIKGTFLSGDDIQLVRDHVYVNRPSLDHAVKLFTIIHRDLYQPVALLSLSLDFYITKTLGLQSIEEGAPPGAWVFHLTNVLIHGANAVLVVMLLRRWTQKQTATFIAGLLFAIHPLNVETVAWLNGRMMLLSTFFLLATLIVMEDWRSRSHWWKIPIVLALVALCMMSKVRVCLPALLVVTPMMVRQWPTRRWWLVWGAVTLTTALFAWVNIRSSSSMIARGDESLQGSRVARTTLAIGWYWSHAVYPAGLSPSHPAPETIAWSEPKVLASALALVAVALIVLRSSRRTRIGWIGMCWFLAAIAVTLPIIPSRNLLVAERYTYLANIGLFFIIASGIAVLLHRQQGKAKTAIVHMPAILLGGALLLTSWKVSLYYRSDLARIDRVSSLYPDYPGLLVRYGWAYFQEERYDAAIAKADAALTRHGPKIANEAYQLLSVCWFRKGDFERALSSIDDAIRADPNEGLAYSRRGMILAASGKTNEAIRDYEKFAQLLPNHNPGLLKLAELYRQTGQESRATSVYSQVLTNNPFDVVALLGIADVEIARKEYAKALARLEEMLTWMPDNVPALVNAGLCLSFLGKTDEAKARYEQAISLDPHEPVAVANLAGLLIAENNRPKAAYVLDLYLERAPTDRDMLDAACNNRIAIADYVAAANLLVRAMRVDGEAPDLCCRYAYVSCLAGQWEMVEDQLNRLANSGMKDPFCLIAECSLSLKDGKSVEAIALADRLREGGDLEKPYVYDALIKILEQRSSIAPEEPWPYYILCSACLATNQRDAAILAAEEFKRRCGDTSFIEKIDALLSE